MKLYIVMYGMHGYLPNSINAFRTKRESETFMSDLVKELRSSGEHWSGSAREGYYENTDPHSLWYIELSEEVFENEEDLLARMNEINES